MSKAKVIIIATDGIPTRLLYEELSKHFEVARVLLEQPESTRVKIRRRFKKLPFHHVIGQLTFIAFLVPVLKRLSRKRIREIIAAHDYTGAEIPHEKIVQIDSINNPDHLTLIHELQPALVFVNGTRIIRKKIIDRLPSPVMNIHVGITPEYRGIHGGYWALYRGDRGNFGVTLHEIDAGVDTGRIIAQKKLEPGPKDSFATYPLLQYCAGLKLIAGNLPEHHTGMATSPADKGKQHYHPRFFPYLVARWFRGIR